MIENFDRLRWARTEVMTRYCALGHVSVLAVAFNESL